MLKQSQKIDTLLLTFCERFQMLYGASSCNPNLHLHCPLEQCLKDYGPASSFWAFPYKRLNGMLGSIPTNHQDIETQLKRKFSNRQVLQAFSKTNASKHPTSLQLPLLPNMAHYRNCMTAPLDPRSTHKPCIYYHDSPCSKQTELFTSGLSKSSLVLSDLLRKFTRCFMGGRVWGASV